MRILITGGAGFIGSHLAERLVQRNESVCIVDDLNDFYPAECKLANLQAVAQAGPVRFHKLDICDEGPVNALVREFRPEVIVHLAARAGVRPSLIQPLLYERVNVYGTTVLLEAARQFGVRRFVFASSSSVYGAANRVPFSEEDPTDRPISPYAATKLAGEKLCYTWSHLYDVSTVCLRFFTVFGPRQRPDLAIHKFADLIHRGEPIPVFGDGSSGRDYTFVDDIVEGILAATAHDSRFDIFNLGNSHPVSLSDLIASVERILGKEARRKRLPEQPGDVPITYADISKARTVLGYQPRIGFDEGIRRFVAWYLGEAGLISHRRAAGAGSACIQ